MADRQRVTGPEWNARLREGYALLQRGRADLAERAGTELLQASAGAPPALNLIAIALHAQRKHADAAQLFAELTRLEPQDRSHWDNLGTSLRAAGRLEPALAAYQRAAALGASSASFHYNVGLLQVDRGDYEAARKELAEAHRLAPRDAEIAYQYGVACQESSRLDEGASAVANWSRLEGLSTELIAKLAVLLLNLGRPADADVAFETARSDPRPSPEARLQIATALERTNRLTEARRELDILLALPADGRRDVDVRGLDGRLAQREGEHETAARIYRELADACAEEERKHYVLYPLAKSLDALGRYDEAFATLEHAHRSHRRFMERMTPDIAVRRNEPMRIARRGCDPGDVAEWRHEHAPAASESPVFIVAYPRSGTTLLEHTLDAHPGLRTMDEQPVLQLALERLAGPGVHYPERLAALTATQLDNARRHYWSLVASKVQLEPGQRLLDKNPLNIVRLPAIRRLFPNSPIVLAIRHPCDVILSCYMQHFRAEFGWLCRDLDTLSTAYTRSFDFWYGQAALLEPRVLEIRYERFVVDFERHVRELAEFLELSWDAAMLSPGLRARDRGFISTPSYAQVIEPVNTRSVDRWRNYGRHFQPVVSRVRPYLDRWGYAA
jgi:tetratricopeptide (TPR) repeat protein